jgi:hypothetical protein
MNAKYEPKYQVIDEEVAAILPADLIDVTPAPAKKPDYLTPLGLTAFSVFLIGDLFYAPPIFDSWRDWLRLVGAVFAPILAIISICALAKGWSDEQTDKAAMRAIGYTALAPIALVAALLLGFAVYSFFGWLAAIPSWAAAVVLLLIYIAWKK